MTDSSERKERPQSGMEIVRRPSNPHACARDEATENDREEHAALDSVDPDEVLFPDPFHEPADFAPIPAPQARLADVLELAGHIAFVLLITIVIPLAILWAGYLYRWLPFETWPRPSLAQRRYGLTVTGWARPQTIARHKAALKDSSARASRCTGAIDRVPFDVAEHAAGPAGRVRPPPIAGEFRNWRHPSEPIQAVYARRQALRRHGRAARDDELRHGEYILFRYQTSISAKASAPIRK